MQKQNTILGIDPGLNITGYGVLKINSPGQYQLVEAGIIRTKLKDGLSKRIHHIFQGVSGIIKELKPDLVVLEELYSHYKHPTTAIKMAHARGMTLLAAEMQGVKVIGYPAKKIKKAVTGNGNASKEQVRDTIKQILSIRKVTGPLDVTDALALCLGHIYLNQGHI